MNHLSDRHLQWLCAHGLLPRGTTSADCGGASDLFSCLGGAWRLMLAAAQGTAQRSQAIGVVDWLRVQQRQSAALTIGVPGVESNRVAQWVGQRLIWWPRGIPSGRRTALVSSRLGRPVDRRRHWFSALRTVCREIDADREILVSAPGMTASHYLERCSRLFSVPLLMFQLPHRKQQVRQWFRGCLANDRVRDVDGDLIWPAVVSPPLDEEPVDPSPVRDRIVVAVADKIVACRLRNNGHTFRLLERRLTETPTSVTPHVVLVTGKELVPARIAEALQAKGAQLRMIDRPPERVGRYESLLPSGFCERSITPMTLDAFAPQDYLTHWTRRAAGPWPDQDPGEYLDDLILDRRGADHSPLAALHRIVGQQRLWASGDAIRGGHRVVCFTEIGVRQLLSFRQFRPHRGRWDFEPYGICIRLDWLRRQGAQPVQYGDADLWDQLSEFERPFFQTRFAGKGNAIDWSMEREWRHVGDLDLRRLPADAAFLFVRQNSEVEMLTQVSRWPVVVCR